MPWVLPKMHEALFLDAFELTAIVLAFIEPRLAVVAILAQINALLSYLPFSLYSGVTALGVPIAAILNTLVLVSLHVRLWTGQFRPSLVTATAATAVVTYIGWCGFLSATFPSEELSKWWPGERFMLRASLPILLCSLYASSRCGALSDQRPRRSNV